MEGIYIWAVEGDGLYIQGVSEEGGRLQSVYVGVGDRAWDGRSRNSRPMPLKCGVGEG